MGTYGVQDMGRALDRSGQSMVGQVVRVVFFSKSFCQK